MKKLPNSLFRLLGGLIALFLLHGCGSYRLATLNHDPIYPVDYVIPVTNDTKIDTINSLFDLKYKLRTDFSFRWDFAQYAMNQPYSWYWNNPRLDLMFIFIVIGFGLIGLGTTLSIIIHGDGIIGIDLIIFTVGTVLTGLGIIYGILITIIIMLFL